VLYTDGNKINGMQIPESECDRCGIVATVTICIFETDAEITQDGISLEYDKPLTNDIEILQLCKLCLR
jgi:hypothetical protein